MTIILSIVVILAIILYFLGGYVMAKRIMFPQKRDYEIVKAEELACCNVKDPKAFDIVTEEFTMQSKSGPVLCAHYFKPNYNTGKYLLFNHGYNYPYSSVIKYLPIFLENGIGVFAPDHRGSGKSDDAPITFGYFEHADSIEWISKIEEIAKADGYEDPQIGVMGESMGSATSLLIASKDPRIKFCIADCGYSSWSDILKHRCVVEFGRKFLIFMPAARLMIKLLSGANVKDVNIIGAAKKIQVPTLIIHGDADDYVPYSMGEQIAASNENFKFFTQKNAGHARAVATDFETYKQQIHSFLKEFGFLDSL